MSNKDHDTLQDLPEAPSCQGADEAIKRFEKIMMSRIYLQEQLGDRLKVSIRTGMAVLFLLAISVLILIITLTIQVKRVSEVASNMDTNFQTISKHMNSIHHFMGKMETQISYIPQIKSTTSFMRVNMTEINGSLTGINNQVTQMNNELISVQNKIKSVSSSVQLMDNSVNNMNGEVYRLSKPAKSLNKFMPF
ncbi:MAG: hypothetical protein HQL46_08365 [Gammaproteobacteria bacterium]|nr:hypothetical protein [Gammaproteobacteria bacterium]